jgi:hypothetical protein
MMRARSTHPRVERLTDDRGSNSSCAATRMEHRSNRMTRRTSRHLLSRRETLRLIGAAGATAVVALSGEPAMRFLRPGKRGSIVSAQTLSCVVRPQLTEGPYFVDERLNRSDIRTDPVTNTAKPGSLLTLTFNVNRVSGNNCTALSGAYVDVWHCDALGTYSDVRDAGFDTRGQKYLRGYQVTDSVGAVQFRTLYPRLVLRQGRAHPLQDSPLYRR